MQHFFIEFFLKNVQHADMIERMTIESEGEPQEKGIDPDVLRKRYRDAASDLYGDGAEEEYTFEHDPIGWDALDDIFSGPDEKSEKPTYEPVPESDPQPHSEKIGPDTPGIGAGGRPLKKKEEQEAYKSRQRKNDLREYKRGRRGGKGPRF